MYDIAIVGAGPAGATLARLVGKSYKVLLLEKRQFTATTNESPLNKCCGGLLAPDAQSVLAQLGLGIPREVLVGPQLFTVRTIDVKNSIEQYYQRHYINLDRAKFDQWLVSLIPSEVKIQFSSTFKYFEIEDNSINIYYHKNRKQYRERARVLVGADGARSTVRKQLSPDSPYPKAYIALHEWYETKNALPYFSAIFDEEITDFYSWTIPKEDYLIIGSALSHENRAVQRFERLRSILRAYGYEFGKLIKKNGALLLRPKQINQIFTGEGNISLIGESAGWISPSSAEGFSYSFRSARALAESLHRSLDNYLMRYNRNARGLKYNILLKNLKSPFMYNPVLRGVVMKSGLRSMKIHAKS
jgi:geranylgeranyl reductase